MKRKHFQILLIVLGLLSPIVAPAGARVCCHLMANLVMLDTGHPVDPCVDAMATMEAAVVTVTNYVMTVGLPLTAVASIFALSFISLFCTNIISCQLLFFPPQTPPPRILD
jgi:hypothetical protein